MYTCRYALVVEYVGTDFHGSQIQPDTRTVQEEIQKALTIYFKAPVKTVFSGRTDAGVHAKGQVLHFDIKNNDVDSNRFLYAINSILPDDISVSEIVEVNRSFHAQKSAAYRWYRYTIANRKYKNAFDSRILHERTKLDIDLINQALDSLTGEHDFSSFCSLKTSNPNKVCKLYYAKAHKDGDYIYIDLVANRFLYNMVRIIAGMILEIGRNKLTPQFAYELLISKNRTKAPKTASANALTLEFVGYKNKGFDNVVFNKTTLSEQLKDTQHAKK
ncbi:MAG: tRNA pseudouridine(38-40) synthase TruA [Candidatus Gastranaerophilales bacterium]|nr:tRNA pseudouridine(38-40) synthase TruA [Candidatus Gastranaerophilales bacterium]